MQQKAIKLEEDDDNDDFLQTKHDNEEKKSTIWPNYNTDAI